MSENNKDESNAIVIMFAFFGAVMMAVAAFVVALLAFAAVVLTILAIVAWNNPLRIGKLTIMPDDARGFVYRGVIGMFLVPAFLLFVAVVIGVPIDWSLLPYIMLAGYVGGSIGLEILLAEDPQGGGTVHHHPVLPTALAQPPQRLLPPADRAPSSAAHASADAFRYASWNDEEERGR